MKIYKKTTFDWNVGRCCEITGTCDCRSRFVKHDPMRCLWCSLPFVCPGVVSDSVPKSMTMAVASTSTCRLTAGHLPSSIQDTLLWTFGACGLLYHRSCDFVPGPGPYTPCPIAIKTIQNFAMCTTSDDRLKQLSNLQRPSRRSSRVQE